MTIPHQCRDTSDALPPLGVSFIGSVKSGKRGLLLLAGMFLSLDCPLHVHEDKHTHPALTVGAMLFMERTHPEDGSLIPNSGRLLIRQGSIDEDACPNFLSHFYDPKTGQNTTPRPNFVPGCGFTPSDFVQQTAPARASGFWADAVTQYRSGDTNAAFHSIGRVMHLLGDMSSPAHVHNDVHAQAGLPDSGCTDGDDFENWGWSPECGLRDGMQNIYDYITDEGNTASWALRTNLLIGLENIFNNQPRVATPLGGDTNPGYTFVRELANEVYDFTTFEVVLQDTYNSNDRGSGELKTMFPSLEETTVPAAWWIQDIGYSQGQCSGAASSFPQDWWMMSCTVEGYCGSPFLKSAYCVTGLAYIENIGGGTGHSYEIPDTLVPAQYDRQWFAARYGSKFNSGRSMLQIYGDVLYPAAVTYGAGLLLSFLDDAIMPKPMMLGSFGGDGSTMLLTGEADAGGVAAWAWFEWGVTTNYGNSTAPQSIGAGTNFLGVAASINGLTPNQTYHCRLISSNQFGVRRSTDRMFQTEDFIIAGGGLNAWQIADDSTASGSTLSYITNLTAGQNQAATNSGWHFTAVSRLTADIRGSKTMHLLYSHGARRFLVWWDFDLNGDLFAEVEGIAQPFKLAANGLGAKQYHTHEVLYTNGIATYFFDGSPITSWTGSSISGPAGRVQWGAGASGGQGSMNYHAVSFDISGMGRVASYHAGMDGAPPPTPAGQGWTRIAGGFSLFEQSLAPDGDAFVPIALTFGASEVQSHGAQLNALANPNGDDSAGWFEWGSTTSYGNRTLIQNIGNGLANTNFSAVISGLEVDSIYHYRVIASNSFGVRFGNDQELQTSAYLLSGAVPNAWQITDDSTASGSILSYSTNLAVAQRTAAASSWRFLITSRLLTDFSGLRTMTFVYGNGTRRYLVWWDLDANGRLTAELEGQPVINVASNAAAMLYHTHELSFTNGVATYRVDGKTIGSWAGVVSSANANQALWGSGSSPGMGQMNFQRVEFQVGGSNVIASYNPGSVEDSTAAPDPVSQGWSINQGAVTLEIGSIAPDVEAYLPRVETLQANAVGAASAELNSQISTRGQETSAWFEWGATMNHGNRTAFQTVDAALDTAIKSAVLDGLSVGTPYFFRAAASNQWGTAFGVNQTFVTSWFTQVVTTLPAVDIGSLDWGDFDNDGDHDILMSGQGQSSSMARVYRNDGNGTFSDINAGLPSVNWSEATWGDFDNDTYLDILLTGLGQTGLVARIYRNDGGTNFSSINAGLAGVWKSAQAWFDFDNDGDLDAVITGLDAGGFPTSRIYRNDGSAHFSDINAGLPGLAEGSVASGDFDGDGDLDIVLTGRDTTETALTCYYRNNGEGSFTIVDLNLPGVYQSALAAADYDSDGDLDLLLSGSTGEGSITRLFRNIRNGTALEFETINNSFADVSASSIAWGDFDNDGNPDVALTGWSGAPFAAIYRSNGDGTFNALTVGLIGAFWSSAVWGDFDRDSDLDLLVSGRNDPNGQNTRAMSLYGNVSSATNSPPAAPTALVGSGVGGTAQFEWQAAVDMETPASGLTYNVVLATTPGGGNLTSPMADVTSGFRRVVQAGNAGENLFWSLRGLDPGTYYFSVQAIDSTFAGGAFAPWQMIEVAPQPIVIVAVEAPSHSQLRLQFVGPANGSYEVMRSADLKDWSMIGSAAEVEAGLFEFQDAATPPPGAFYRIRSTGM
ncbi:MAG TPA: FG-GAP-like repeat-containing protein [Verrucomicrobiae bacterium]|nr:FG-GAP-like repeat-containing protein [Verrucomicrobiae bacterium]